MLIFGFVYDKIYTVSNMKKIIPVLFLCVILLCSCGKYDEINGFAMDSPYSIRVSGLSGDKRSEIKKELDKSNTIFDAYNASFLNELNDKKYLKRTSENEDLFKLIKASLPYCGRYFDISVRPYTKLWDFSSEAPIPPSEEELVKASKSVGTSNIIFSDDEIKLINGAEIEAGAVAKGYMCDKVYNMANGAEGIFDIGGTIKSSVDRPISVGVRNPDGGAFCSFYINRGESVSTSGSYERNFTYNGNFYHHILDPETGKSVNNGLLSVTVISDSALKSDILSTLYFAAGIENAEVSEDVTAIFITNEKKIIQKGNKREIN